MTYPIEHDRVNGSGDFIRAIAGEDLGNRKVVYLASDETWKLADADAAVSMPAIGLTMHAFTSGKPGWILTDGWIGLLTWTWTAGGEVYASTTAGELSQTAPAATGDRIQVIGVATTATQIKFSPRLVTVVGGGTYTKRLSIGADAFGKPAANVPTVVDQDNITLYAFTVNTDLMTYKMPVPADYASGDLLITAIWTNDGGVDDLNKNVRAQMDYQISAEGEIVSGSHANSPKNVNDAYTSNAGFIDCRTGAMTIAAADFAIGDCVFWKISFVTAPVTALTCEPHLVGMCIQYTAYVTVPT